VAFVVSAPAWIVKHPPLQDLPFHLATIRIIRSFHDPAYGFDRDFVLSLGRTQYVVYYLLAAVLSPFLGLVGANVVLVSTYLGGTLLALRELLRALGKDERLCLFVAPVLVNILFVYGLMQFLFGIPVMLWALATAVRHFALGLLGFATKIMYVVSIRFIDFWAWRDIHPSFIIGVLLLGGLSLIGKLRETKTHPIRDYLEEDEYGNLMVETKTGLFNA